MNTISTRTEPAIDPRELRDVLGCFATGVAIVTSIGDEGKPVGMTINSFSSVSLDPPLVLWSIGLKTPSRDAYVQHKSFAINIMGVQTKELSLHFAKPSDDKFAAVDWTAGHKGVPILNEALATLECDIHEQVIAGDHEIFIGRVIRLRHGGGEPLLFHRGKFAHLGELM